MPFRRTKVSDLESGLTVQEVASQGAGLPSSSERMRFSMAGTTASRSLGAPPTNPGSPRLFRPVGMITFKIPPYWGVPAAGGAVVAGAVAVGLGAVVVGVGVGVVTGVGE